MRRANHTTAVTILAAGLAVCALPCFAAGAAWSYSGANGPARWGKLDKEYAQCGVGKLQAPIDIPDKDARKGDLPPLLFNYKPGPLKIEDDGHTIQVNVDSDSWLTVEGRRYQLVEIHFHKPSEFKVNGKGTDMDAHLVHRDKDGKLAVVSVFLTQGNAHPLIKTLWNNLPQTKGKEVVVDAVKLNAVELLPKTKGYYTFAGSLTTPPCTENVQWYVLKTPVQLSGEEIARFARIYPANARPAQPVNERDILGSLDAR